MAVTAPPLSTNLCWLLARASHSLNTEMTAALESLNVSPRAQHVLGTALRGEYTQTELAKLVDLDKTTMVVTMDELEAKGLAERRPSPADRRARIVAVTEAGARKVRESEEIVERVHTDVLESLPAKERRVFLEALTRLATERLSEPVECMQAPRRRAPRG
jgi:MarR family transcriptional regulator for hemolysin